LIFRVPDRGSVNPSALGDGLECMEETFRRILARYLKKDSFSFMPVFLVLREKARMRGYKSRMAVC
jgi:hypothetical protein